MKTKKKVKKKINVNQLDLLHLLYEDPTLEDHPKHIKKVKSKESYLPTPFR